VSDLHLRILREVARQTQRARTVDKNSTVVFPAPLMSTIAELGAFLERESKAAGALPAGPEQPAGSTNGELVPS
jgi:hypothetical protein